MAVSPGWEFMSQSFIFPHAAESDKKIPDGVSIFAHELQKFFQPQALFFRPFNAHGLNHEMPNSLLNSATVTMRVAT